MTKRAKKRIALVVGLIVVVAGGLIIAKQVRLAQRVRMAGELKESGEAARKAGDHRKATQQLGTHLQLAPLARLSVDPALYLEWADSRRLSWEENSRHLFEAIEGAKRAAALMPRDPRPLAMLLDLYAQIGRVPERLETADRLLAIDPTNRDAMFARTLGLRQLGRTADAAAAAVAMAKAHPEDLVAHKVVIQMMIDENRDAKDQQAYAAELAKRFPDNVRILLFQTAVLAHTNDAAGAREIAIRASRMPIADPEALHELLEVLDRLDMTREASDVAARQIESAPPGSQMLVVAAERAWKSGGLDDAKKLILRAVVPAKDATDRLLGWWALVDADNRKPGDPPHEALVELRRRSTPEAAAWAGVLDALDAIARSDWSAARERLSTAIASGAQDDLAQFLLGQVERSLGDTGRAIERWRGLAQREPRWVRLNMDLALALLQQGRHQEAFAYAVRAMAASPDQGAVAPIVMRSAVSLLESGSAEPDQVRAAIEFLETCRKQIGDRGELLALLARAYAAGGKEEQARATAQTIIDQGLEVSAESLRALGAMSRRYGWGLEPSLTDAARARGDDDPSVVFALAMESAQAGRPAEGKSLLEAAVAAHAGPGKIDYEVRLAAYLDSINDPDAKAHFSRLAEQRAGDPKVQIALLQSRCVWSDEAVVSQAISRLRSLAGESSSTWRLYEARRLLTFAPTQENASQAVQRLEDLLRADPHAVPPRELAAEAWIILGDRARAVQCLTQALDSDPQQIRIYPRLIVLLQQEGDTARAERYLRQFGEREDLSDEMRRSRAYLAQTQGAWDLALADLRALSDRGAPADVLALARFHHARGQRAEAEALFARLTDRSDPDPAALVAAAEFFAATDRASAGRSLIERIPDEPAGRRAAILASFEERHGDPAEAARLLASLAQAQDRARAARAWGDLARFHLRQRDIAKAEDALRKGLAAKPDDADLVAADRLLPVIKSREVDPLVGAELLAWGQTGDQAEAARSTIEAVVARHRKPEDAAAYTAALEKIASSHPSFYAVVPLLVEARVRAGDIDKALDAARASANALRSDWRPARLATIALQAAGRREEAIGAARQWLDRAQSDPLDAEIVLAQLNLDLERPAEALRYLEPRRARIVACADARPADLQVLAGALAAAGRDQDAHDLLWDRALADQAWAARYLRVKDYMKARPQDARAWVTRIAPSLLKSAEGRVALGQAWYDLGMLLSMPGKPAAEDFQRAVDALAPALDDPAQGAFGAALTAASLEQIGDRAGAEAMYRRSLKGAPDNPATLNNLAYLILISGGSADEALELATKAVNLAPDVPTFLDTRGAVLLRLGRLAEAEAVYRRAMNIDGGDFTVLLGLAETHVRQGRFADAGVLLDRVDLLARTGRPLDPKMAERLQTLRTGVEQRQTSAADR